MKKRSIDRHAVSRSIVRCFLLFFWVHESPSWEDKGTDGSRYYFVPRAASKRSPPPYVTCTTATRAGCRTNSMIVIDCLPDRISWVTHRASCCVHRRSYSWLAQLTCAPRRGRGIGATIKTSCSCYLLVSRRDVHVTWGKQPQREEEEERSRSQVARRRRSFARRRWV